MYGKRTRRAYALSMSAREGGYFENNCPSKGASKSRGVCLDAKADTRMMKNRSLPRGAVLLKSHSQWFLRWLKNSSLTAPDLHVKKLMKKTCSLQKPKSLKNNLLQVLIQLSIQRSQASSAQELRLLLCRNHGQNCPSCLAPASLLHLLRASWNNDWPCQQCTGLTGWGCQGWEVSVLQ